MATRRATYQDVLDAPAHRVAEIVDGALRKGQAGAFALEGGILGEAKLVERGFGVGPCALTVAVTLLQNHLATAQS